MAHRIAALKLRKERNKLNKKFKEFSSGKIALTELKTHLDSFDRKCKTFTDICSFLNSNVEDIKNDLKEGNPNDIERRLDGLKFNLDELKRHL